MLDLARIPEAVRSEGGISRRLMLAYAAALVAVPTLGLRAQEAKAKNIKGDPFKLGVASGEPTDDGVVLWTRLAPEPLHPNGGMPPGKVEVRWEVLAEDGKKVVQSGKEEAAAALGHSVHVVVKGLNPATRYRYRFHCGNDTSPEGRTRTTPAAGSMPDRLRFAFASCQNFEDGHYTAYEHMAKEDLDLVFFLGDYVYEFHPRKDKPRQHAGKNCETLDQYRLRYSQYKADPHLQKMHARCPWVVTWDDHEVEGNYANDVSKNKDKKGVTRAEFLARRADAYRAYYEMMPLRPRAKPKGHDARLYHQTTFGRLVSFKVLDTRQYRTDQPNGDDAADINAAALNPKATLLGAEQGAWLKGVLKKSDATWNVLAQQVMMAMLDRKAGPQKLYSMDAWPGYAHERMDLVKFLADAKVSNPVVLSGDVHSNWVNDLRVDDRKPEQPVVATEFIGTSITSTGDGEDVGQKKLDSLYAENPCAKYHDDHRGYVVCTLTPAQWRSDYRRVPVVSKPGGGVTTSASFVVAAGKPGANKG